MSTVIAGHSSGLAGGSERILDDPASLPEVARSEPENVEPDVVFRYFSELIRNRLTVKRKGIIVPFATSSFEMPIGGYEGLVVALSARNMHGKEGYRGPVVNGLLVIQCYLDARRPDLDISKSGYVWPGMIRRPTSDANPDALAGHYLPYESVVCNDGDLRLPGLSAEFPVHAITTFVGAHAMKHSPSVLLPINIDALAAREQSVRAQSDI